MPISSSGWIKIAQKIPTVLRLPQVQGFGKRKFTTRGGAVWADFKGAEADPDVSSATQFADLPGGLDVSSLPDTGGPEGKAVREEVARVMANPEINGQPVALDFSSKGRTRGYSAKFASNWDLAFGKKSDKSADSTKENNN